MAEIGFSQVKKRYGGTQVIHGIDMQIADGEFIVIVGPSGCGKSTLLRMVAGLEAISEGEISIGGRVVNDLEPKDRNIAMVFQNYALYPHMSVYDNMAYGLKIAKLDKTQIEERVQRAAKMLELAQLLQRKPRQLSGGQRQRVAMGRAIVRDPGTFLFDEPLSNLDAKLRVQMRLEIKQLQRSLGTTSLYVTHDQVEAMTLADRLIVMNAGVAEQIDTPMAIYDRPASRFVAGFIGSPAMNFLTGQVDDAGRGLMLERGTGLRSGNLRLGHLAGRPVTVGVRPEHLQLAAKDAAEMHLLVRVVETLGADILAHGHLVPGDGPPSDAVKEILTLRLPGVARVAEGDRLPLRAAEETLHLFDSESGRRLADV
ncbi:sn-glycerol-3-phosphate import ATP-binding protein UgpC [Algihabitans albus]|uniref:sn-glycerol-3-phosphate import ATP-binding protein UgpC n=1 Tax=Algihabitans albus TaxID=2164067 RepID=UPI000E5D09F9|nr:sn-glycerol-3-phosphate import ATP-binding protein UgpC [Algihabitans albus]